MASDQRSVMIKNSLRIKILILLLTVLSVVFMFPKGESIESEVTVGSIWIQDDLIASTSFPIYKDPEIYNQEKQQASKNVYPVFIKQDSMHQRSIDSLEKYNQHLLSLLDHDLKSDSAEINYTFLSGSSYNAFKKMRRAEIAPGQVTAPQLHSAFATAKDIIKRAYRVDILSLLYTEINKDSIAARQGKFDRIEPKRKYQDLRIVHDLIAGYANGFSRDAQFNNALIEYVNHFVKPNLTFSDKATEDERIFAMSKVSPNVGIVNENERIIAKHDRVTPDAKLKIDSYRKAKAEDLGFINKNTQFLGKFFHILFILTLYIIYLYLFRKRIFDDNIKILLISIIILLISFITFVIHQLNVSSPVHLLIIIPAASMLLTIMFDSRVGFYGTVIVALITGALRGNDYSFAAMNIFAGALAAYTVRDIKNRTQIFRSFLYILLGYMTGILAFGLERFETSDKILIEMAFAASNALISPVITFGLIIFFERIFRITTDLTLLELTDFNRPLLKELARKAPGTFTHSMTVGSLVERAAEAIGANPLLARVGAYYHDVGKLLSPANFVENQISNENTHENLNPEDSAAIIINHVSNGIELAEREDLPQEIIDFIPMHHGTLVVSYFYEKAKELYGEESVDIEKFRYKGPKPNTKETALVMLADACESTVRSITEPDQQKVENVINNLIKNRLEDGQLNESPLTIKDLQRIKESFVTILIGQHHKRIRYPKQEEMENLNNNGSSDDGFAS